MALFFFLGIKNNNEKIICEGELKVAKAALPRAPLLAAAKTQELVRLFLSGAQEGECEGELRASQLRDGPLTFFFKFSSDNKKKTTDVSGSMIYCKHLMSASRRRSRNLVRTYTETLSEVERSEEQG